MKPLLDGQKALASLPASDDGKAPGIGDYSDPSAIGVANYTYGEWLEAHKKWQQYAQAGLATDEQALLGMMREVAQREMEERQVLEGEQKPLMPANHVEPGTPMQDRDFAGPSPFPPLYGPDGQSQPVQFTRCRVCLQVTPDHIDCTFCGTPTERSRLLKEYLNYGKR